MYDSPKKKISFFILALLFLGGAFFVGNYYGYEKRLYADTLSGLMGDKFTVPDTNLSPLWEAWRLVDEKYVFPDKPTDEEKLWGAISGLVGSIGDPYSSFLPPREASIFEDDIAGNFGGIGVEMGKRDDILTVISPLRDTPAYKAGVKSGDKIIEIDGVSTLGMSVDEAVLLIRGERGKPVDVTIFREGKTADDQGETIEFTIIRDTINIPTIDTEIKDGIFIIRLYNFSAKSPELFERALVDFTERSPSNKLIIDLRGNPGGFLDASVEMASLFLPKGKIVVSEDFGEGKEALFHRSKGYNFFKTSPQMVILVDGGTASAAEILAVALAEHDLAKVVGDKTFGKGSVQELVPLTEDTYIKITIAKWLTPKGRSLEKEGVAIDVMVKNENGEDAQLKKAIEILK